MSEWWPTIAVLTVSAACVAFAIWSIVHKGPLVLKRKETKEKHRV